MSETERAQGGPEHPVYVGGSGKPDLAMEEQDFLKMLCGVLPKLASGLEKPTSTDGSSPSLDQEPISSPDKEVHEGLDTDRGREEQLFKAREQYWEAYLALHETFRKFKEVESRIRTVEGGVQLMDALVELRDAIRYGYRDFWIISGDQHTRLSSIENASATLFRIFKNLGEDVFKEIHLAPLRELYRFCIDKPRGSRSMADKEDIEMRLSLSRHIYNITRGLSELFESSLTVFLETRENAQRINYNNMLTAATFFSAVTATTLQLSYAYNTNTRVSFGVTVNTYWFVALVFSTASSLNSLVGLTWYQKIRRNQLLPDWVKLWFEYGPTISLAVASAAFSIGLCLFAFSSSQHTITSTLTVTFTAAHAAALFVPLCLYSPNRLSRFLKNLLSYCNLKKVWYLRNVPKRDWILVAEFMDDKNWSRANVIDALRYIEAERVDERGSKSDTGFAAVTSSTGNTGLESKSSPIGLVKGSIKLTWTSALSFFVVITRWPDWLTLRLAKTRTTDGPSNTELVQEADEKVDTLSRLESDIWSNEHAREPGTPNPIVTGGRDPAPLQRPRTPILDATNQDGAGPTAKVLGREFGNSLDDLSAPESAKGPTAAASFTADSFPNPSSSPMVQDLDNGLEDGSREAVSTCGRRNTSQKEEPGPSFDYSVREGVEAHNNGVSNSASEAQREREGIVE